jgi:hypothetical protein
VAVKAIIAVEPPGPPFENAINATGKGRACGPTDIPITYDPLVKDDIAHQIDEWAQKNVT